MWLTKGVACVEISRNLYAWFVVFVKQTITTSRTVPWVAGVEISGDLYAWLVVFVLPVNSALNPLLYTLTTKLFKQRLITGLAAAVWRRRSLETNSSSNFSFSSLKSRGSSPRSEKDLNEVGQLRLVRLMLAAFTSFQ